MRPRGWLVATLPTRRRAAIQRRSRRGRASITVRRRPGRLSGSETALLPEAAQGANDEIFRATARPSLRVSPSRCARSVCSELPARLPSPTVRRRSHQYPASMRFVTHVNLSRPHQRPRRVPSTSSERSCVPVTAIAARDHPVAAPHLPPPSRARPGVLRNRPRRRPPPPSRADCRPVRVPMSGSSRIPNPRRRRPRSPPAAGPLSSLSRANGGRSAARRSHARWVVDERPRCPQRGPSLPARGGLTT